MQKHAPKKYHPLSDGIFSFLSLRSLLCVLAFVRNGLHEHHERAFFRLYIHKRRGFGKPFGVAEPTAERVPCHKERFLERPPLRHASGKVGKVHPIAVFFIRAYNGGVNGRFHGLQTFYRVENKLGVVEGDAALHQDFAGVEVDLAILMPPHE